MLKVLLHILKIRIRIGSVRRIIHTTFTPTCRRRSRSRRRRPRLRRRERSRRGRGSTGHSPSSSSRFGSSFLGPRPNPTRHLGSGACSPRDAPEWAAFPRPRLSWGSGFAFRASREWRWSSSRVRVLWVWGCVLGRHWRTQGGLGWLQPPSWTQIFFNNFLFSKRLNVFGIFLCLVYESLLLSTLNQYWIINLKLYLLIYWI